MGADKLSKLESGLAAVKLLAVVSFIIASFLLILGAFKGAPRLGIGNLTNQTFMPGGITATAGSLLIIMFAYAGFEIIGLASSEAREPRKTVPRAIAYTVLSLVVLYILSVVSILLLIPTAELGLNVSPMVSALNRQGIGWAGTILNIVLITAILSTMLAAMFGLGRMIRSLADKQHAPDWLKDKRDIPLKGILFSGFSMLAALGLGLLFPSVYLFLTSSGGFAVLFTYAVIIATQIKFRKKYGCPPEGKCQMPGYPYAPWAALFVIVIAIASMPFIPEQVPGMIAGILMVALFSFIYIGIKFFKRTENDRPGYHGLINKAGQSQLMMELSKELSNSADIKDEDGKDECKEDKDNTKS